MSPVADWVFVLLLPTLVGVAVFRGIPAARRLARRLTEARLKPSPAEPIDRLQADLRRLRAELEDTETRSGLTAKHHRVQALRAAYVDALSAACQRLEVSPLAGGDRVPLPEIYRVEAALRQRGLDVRQHDVRETAAR